MSEDSEQIQCYAIEFPHKGQAWRVYRKVTNGRRSQGLPLDDIKISNSTITARNGLVATVEDLAERFNFTRYKTKEIAKAKQ